MSNFPTEKYHTVKVEILEKPTDKYTGNYCKPVLLTGILENPPAIDKKSLPNGYAIKKCVIYGLILRTALPLGGFTRGFKIDYPNKTFYYVDGEPILDEMVRVRCDEAYLFGEVAEIKKRKLLIDIGQIHDPGHYWTTYEDNEAPLTIGEYLSKNAPLTEEYIGLYGSELDSKALLKNKRIKMSKEVRESLNIIKDIG